MICFTPRISLETEVKYMRFFSYWCKANWWRVSKQKSVYCHIYLAVLVNCINNQTTTLWNSSNTTDNALLQRLGLSFLVPAPLNLVTVYFSDIDECNAANNSCHENAWCNNTQGSFDCFCKPGYDGDGLNCTGKIICMRLVNVSTYKVTRPSYFVRVPSYFEALWYLHLCLWLSNI